jgi:hypothetical protein
MYDKQMGANYAVRQNAGQQTNTLATQPGYDAQMENYNVLSLI